MGYMVLIIFVMLGEAHMGIAMETKMVVCEEGMFRVPGVDVSPEKLILEISLQSCG